MDCKNCHHPLSDDNNYCPACGGKVATGRITLKSLTREIISTVFGWDNKYLFTLRSIISQPHLIFKEYLEGVRKKYMNPFGFFAIGAAISLLVFNQFGDRFIEITSEINRSQIDLMEKAMHENLAEAQKKKYLEAGDTLSADIDVAAEFKREQMERALNIQKSVLKYFNLFAFALLPVYALIAFLVFGKPYNFGEHLVISAYLQGVTFLSSVLLFMTSLFLSPQIYYSNLLLIVVFYTYAYGRLYQLSLGKSLLKILRFLAVLIGVFLAFFIVVIVFAIIIGLTKKFIG